jgi:hypothetical protein
MRVVRVSLSLCRALRKVDAAPDRGDNELAGAIETGTVLAPVSTSVSAAPLASVSTSDYQLTRTVFIARNPSPHLSSKDCDCE